MGVKGLFSLLNKKRLQSTFMSQPFSEHVPIVSGSVLCIDAFGFLFAILDHDESNQFGREFGGSYEDLHSMIAHKISLILQCGIRPIFYFDGKAPCELKADTLLNRKVDQNDEWLVLENKLQNSSEISHGERVFFPLPPLTTLQYRISIEEICTKESIEVVYCDSEADQPLALRCGELNQEFQAQPDWNPLHGPRSFVLGRDTDFLIMKDCPYIRFEELEFLTEDEISSKAISSSLEPSQLKGCIASVWDRARVAKYLGLSEDQFVEFVIMVGNDYTRGFPRTLYDFSHLIHAVTEENELAEENEDGDFSKIKPLSLIKSFICLIEDAPVTFPYALMCLLEFVKRSGPHFRARVRPVHESDSKEVQEQLTRLGWAIEYSRLVYNHGDSESFLREIFPTPPNRESLEEDKIKAEIEESSSQELSEVADSSPSSHSDLMALSKEDRKWFEIEDLPSQLERTSIPRLVLQRISVAISTPDLPLTSCFNLFTSSHVMSALSHMVEEYETTSESCMTSYLEEGVNSEWRDLFIANYYQAACKKLIDSAKDCGLSVLPPSRLFNGFRFFNKLNQLRLTEPTTPHSPRTSSPRFPVIGPQDLLPIEEHKDNILATIDQHRVTIIQGETGCGKSTRLPLMILEEADKTGAPCRMFISQPSRIAVEGLMNRLRPALGNRVGMRMKGLREVTKETQITFATTGYLVKLLSHNPKALKGYTHIIIDEVHERSLDGDLICWLCRNLLAQFQTGGFKLILMSATVATSLYREYFTTNPHSEDERVEHDEEIPSIFVGARRFPVRTFFIEDLVKSPDPASRKIFSNVMDRSKALNAKSNIPNLFLESQYQAVSNIVHNNIPLGKTVMVFVASISDIVRIAKFFESNPRRYHICPIHSEIPIEEQMKIFQASMPGQTKVIIATKAAESSLTLPDVDYVICLGTVKSMKYQSETHSMKLTRSLISQASAVQRSGRTGRVRPGTVYRLYSRETFEKMDAHQEAEVKVTTLEKSILWLLSTMGSTPDFPGVRAVLSEMIESPELLNISSSFEELHRMGMIDDTRDGVAKLTELGALAAVLPVDICYAQLIIYGMKLGLTKEAVIMAAGLTLSTSIFEVPNPVYNTDPNVFNSTLHRVLDGNMALDQGIYSSPIIFLSIFIKYTLLRKNNIKASLEDFFEKNGIRRNQMTPFLSDCESLYRQVTDFRFGHEDFDEIETNSPPIDPLSNIGPVNPEKVNRLKLILAWAGKNSILRQTFRKKDTLLPPTHVNIMDGEVQEAQLKPLFPSHVRFQLKESSLNQISIPLSLPDHPDQTLVTNFLRLLSHSGGFKDLSCTWIIYESPKDSVLDSEQPPSNSEQPQPPLGSDSDSDEISSPHILLLLRTEVSDALRAILQPSTQEPNPNDPFVRVANYLNKIFEFSDTNTNTLEDSPAFCMLDPLPLTESKLKQLSDFMNDLPLISAIRFFHSEPTKLFFKNVSVLDEKIKSFALEEGSRLNPDTEITPSMIFLSKTQLSSQKFIQFEPNQNRDMLNCPPLGARYLQSYCSGYPTSWTEGPFMKFLSPRGEPKPVHFRLPSVKWLLICKQFHNVKAENDVEDVEETNFDDEEYGVTGDNGEDDDENEDEDDNENDQADEVEEGTAQNTTTVTVEFKAKNAYIDRFSSQSSAAHYPSSASDRVYGAAMTTRFLANSVISVGVTIFPPGARWATLAYLCLGEDLTAESIYYTSFSDDQDDLQNRTQEEIQADLFRRPDESDRSHCDRIRDLLNSSSIYSPNPDLLVEVDSLFQPWATSLPNNHPIFQRHNESLIAQRLKTLTPQPTTQNNPARPSNSFAMLRSDSSPRSPSSASEDKNTKKPSSTTNSPSVVVTPFDQARSVLESFLDEKQITTQLNQIRKEFAQLTLHDKIKNNTALINRLTNIRGVAIDGRNLTIQGYTPPNNSSSTPFPSTPPSPTLSSPSEQIAAKKVEIMNRANRQFRDLPKQLKTTVLNSLDRNLYLHDKIPQDLLQRLVQSLSSINGVNVTGRQVKIQIDIPNTTPDSPSSPEEPLGGGGGQSVP